VGAPSPRVFASSCALCTVSARNAGTGAQEQLSCTPEARATGPPSRPMTVWAWPCWPRESSCGHCWFTGGHRFVLLWPHVSLLKLASHFRHPGARPQQWPPYYNPWSLWPLVSGHWCTTSCTDVHRHRTVAWCALAVASLACAPDEHPHPPLSWLYPRMSFPSQPAQNTALTYRWPHLCCTVATVVPPIVPAWPAGAAVVGPHRACSAGICGGPAGRARVRTAGTIVRGSSRRRGAKDWLCPPAPQPAYGAISLASYRLIGTCAGPPLGSDAGGKR
jgi:hypothetical protein